jgi:hypothetical protein
MNAFSVAFGGKADIPQDFLAINAAIAAFETKASAAAKTDKDEELIWQMLLRFYRDTDSWTPYSTWFEATKAARGGKLGNSTFSDKVKELVVKGKVRLNEKGLYQVVWGGGSSSDMASSSSSHSPTRGETMWLSRR